MAVRPEEELLHAAKLRAGYGRNEVLHGLDLAVASGEVVALVGRNGAGKTTLLRCLTGIHRDPAGSVTVKGVPPRAGHNVAFCPQAPDAVLFADTVEDEIRATLAAVDGDGAAREWLQDMGIEELSTSHPREVSAGQRVLVAIAAIAATGAPLLLLDEPTRGLDREAKDKLAELLRDWARTRGATLFATHDVELVARVATRVVVLAAGEIVADGPPADVLSDSPVFSPQMTRVFGRGWLTPEQVAGALATAERSS
jgi:energy-coupling factor transport system ATP-binding protein